MRQLQAQKLMGRRDMSPVGRGRTATSVVGTDWRFHHVGLASRHIDDELLALGGLGYQTEGGRFADERQGIRGQIMVGRGPRIEIPEPVEGSRTLEPWLAKGVKMYHLAFEVDDLDQELLRQRSAGAMVVGPPTPAVAFRGRRIAFLMLRSLPSH
jgi:methylmalonyl-CoA/ethylmalonyl-CoA epimerase